MSSWTAKLLLARISEQHNAYERIAQPVSHCHPQPDTTEATGLSAQEGGSAIVQGRGQPQDGAHRFWWRRLTAIPGDVLVLLPQWCRYVILIGALYVSRTEFLTRIRNAKRCTKPRTVGKLGLLLPVWPLNPAPSRPALARLRPRTGTSTPSPSSAE